MISILIIVVQKWFPLLKNVNRTYDIILEFNPGLLCYLCHFYIYELKLELELTSIKSLNNSTKWCDITL